MKPAPKSEVFDRLREEAHMYRRCDLHLLTPPAWLVQGLIPRPGITLLTGASETRKSFFVLDLMAAVVSGRDFFDRPTERGGAAALIFNSEQSQWFNARVEALEVIYPGCDLSHIWMHDGPFASGRDRFSSGNCSATAQQMLETVRLLPQPLRLIVIDTLSDSAAVSGVDEDDNSQVAAYLQSLRQFGREVAKLQRGLVPAIVCVHHPGKPGGRGYRGASAWLNNTDVTLQATINGNVTTIESIRDKTLAPAQRATLRFRLVPVSENQRRAHWKELGPYCTVQPVGKTEPVIRPRNEHDEQCFTLLAQHPEGLPATRWEKMCEGLSEKKFYAALHRLQVAKRVVKDEGNKRGVWRVVAPGGTEVDFGKAA